MTFSSFSSSSFQIETPVRYRFRTLGSQAVLDHELLELVLERSTSQKRARELAARLIAHFGTFAEVVTAPVSRLIEIEGVSPAKALQIKIAEAAAERIARGAIHTRPVMSSWRMVLDYCRTAMAFSEREHFRVLFLNSRCAVIANEEQQRGTVNHTPVYPREVVRRAIELSASAVILIHNHPSGDPTPSGADIRMTHDIICAAGPLGITVHDHIIVGREGYASFRELGLLSRK